MDRTERTLTAICIALILLSIMTLIALPSINTWERDAGFPYGKLCDLYRNC